MKTLKRIIVGALGVLGFFVGLSEKADLLAILLIIGAISLGLYWNRFGQLEDDNEFI